MNSLNRIYLFIENINEYIEVQSIKINIEEESGFICFNRSTEINCNFFNEDNFNKSLIALKYNKLLYESKNSINPKTGRCEILKKDIVSDIILYVSKNNEDLIKIVELKNVMITYINLSEYEISLTCDYYIFHNNEQYSENIYNKISINYNRCNNQIYMPYYNNSDKTEAYEDNYDYDDWNDYDDYNYEEDDELKNNEVDNIFEKSSKLISKIFSNFYK